jgi:ketosteroid isomerase-like protein
MTSTVTPELVAEAYAAVAAGDKAGIEKYWAEDMVWLVPGHNQLSGWKYGRDEFLAFMRRTVELSGGSFHMQTIAVLVGDDYSCDVTNNQGTRAGDPSNKLNIDVAHVLRWRDGQVIAAKGAIFGNGTAEFDKYWGQS